MRVVVKKLTSIETARRACEFTINGEAKSNISLTKLCKMEHSPLRTMMYQIEMIGIPSFVSTHLVRHKIGVEHYVMSNRTDRGGEGNDKVTRNSPVDHMMVVNAAALINIAKKRLCQHSSYETRKVMNLIKEEMNIVEPELASFLVPDCVYRHGACPEHKPCGMGDIIAKRYASYFKHFTLIKE